MAGLTNRDPVRDSRAGTPLKFDLQDGLRCELLPFFGNHVPVSPVQMCGFEGNNLADLRGDFRIFVDTKHQELPGAYFFGPTAGLDVWPSCYIWRV